MRQILELRHEAGQLQEQMERLQREGHAIHKEQDRIRGNMQSLGDRAAEKELRDRFVRTLNTQEDRLEQIGPEVNEKLTAAARCREQINALLEKLEYEAEV